MFRYLALAWDARNASDSITATRVRERVLRQYSTWMRALDRAGLLVLCRALQDRPDHTVVSVSGNGVILGTLFRRNPLCASTRVVELRADEARTIERTRSRSLVSSHWGSYVAMLLDAESGEAHVLRSPLGALPCYAAAHESVSLFFSVVDDLVALRLLRLSLNWPRLRAQVCMSDYLNGETGLTEIRAIDAGSCIHVRGSERGTTAYWTPRSAQWHDVPHSFREGAHELRRVARSCVGSWASAHDAVLTTLSGGLDSSIVLACLAVAPTRPRLACVNFHSVLLGDERGYARSMAERLGVELLERERDPHLDLRRALRCNRTVSPVLHFTGYDSEPAAVQIAGVVGAGAIFNGELGDNLFGSGVRHEVLVEYVQRFGIGPSLIRVAVDYALLRHVSVWRALRLAIRHGFLEPNRPTWSGDHYARSVLRLSADSRLASREALTACEAESGRFAHAWSRDASGLATGKRQLVYALQLVSSSSYESPFTSCDDPPTISPLASQPLAELALSIPTHWHIRGGLNRALAREAFQGDLSESVLHRGSGKGGPELWLRMLIARNREFLRELLLDGVLVRERLLDRGKVERALSEKWERSTPALLDVIAQMYIEAWLRRWTAPEVCAAA